MWLIDFALLAKRSIPGTFPELKEAFSGHPLVWPKSSAVYSMVISRRSTSSIPSASQSRK